MNYLYSETWYTYCRKSEENQKNTLLIVHKQSIWKFFYAVY